MSDAGRRTVRPVQRGPVMVQDPVRIEMPDGTVVDSDRFMVAVSVPRSASE